MSDYYRIPRGADWNYGGSKWRLSRSKIDFFKECPRCFWLDNVRGLKRPASFPFNLNSAVDQLLKTEFDVHRAANTQHPLQAAYKLPLRPAAHEKMNQWRENFEGIDTLHAPTGLTVCGAIDDLWIDDEGTYYVVDYKATAKSEPVTELNEAWQDSYKRQMEVYQWLLRQNGLPVSDTGYFVYCTGKPDEPAFDGKLEFDVHVIPYTGRANWVESTLEEIKRCLDGGLPAESRSCDYCTYRRVLRAAERVE